MRGREGGRAISAMQKTYSLFYKLLEWYGQLISFTHICPGKKPIGTGLSTAFPQQGIGDLLIKELLNKMCVQDGMQQMGAV